MGMFGDAFSSTLVHRCRHCESEHLRKNGHAINGAQRAKWLECARTFLLEPSSWSPRGHASSEQVKTQGLGRLSGQDEHARHPAHLRGLLPRHS
jgi:hypothetical protein